MDDKLFELMTKMYGELSEFRKETNQRLDNLENGQKNLEVGQKNLEVGQKNLENGQKGLEIGLKNLENRQRKLEAIIENDIRNDIKALYDGYKLTYEKLETVEEKVDKLSATVEKQDVEIRVIKGGK